MATAFAVAIIVYKCKSKLSEAEKLDLASAPLQTVDSMYIIQTENGKIQMRVFAPIMEKYDTDTLAYELFPKGINVYAYTDDEVLESTIVANEARHNKANGSNEEVWMAYGNVIIKNIVNQQTMETDTIYWDRNAGEIYTDCYIRMYSPSGFMQGYGMRSDERARNAELMVPFNNTFVVVPDTTEVILDTINFIGPLPGRKSSK